jgi:transposase
VPAKLSARARVFATGQGRKTDPVDARSVAVVALRTTGLRQVVVDDTTVALRLLVDRRDQLGRTRTEVVSRLHHLLLELVPGGAKKFLSATQARALLNTVRPRDVVGKTRRWLASELIHELTVIDKKIKIANAELTELVDTTGSRLQDLTGIGPSGSSATLETSTASPAEHTSHPGTALHPSTPRPATRTATGFHGRETGASTGRCTSWPSSNFAVTPKAAPTTGANSLPARHPWKRCAP